MRRFRRILFACLLVAAIGIGPAEATQAYVPAELAPWESWVLHGQEHRRCPFFFNRAAQNSEDFVCAWPGSLELAVDDRGGEFSQRWTVYAGNAWIALPGDAANWPQQVSADGKGVAVILRGDSPQVYLATGTHEIRGRFEWGETPRNLAVPAQTGMLSLRIAGRPVARPQRSDGGVWLGEREQEKKAEDSLKVNVYRLVADDVPTRLTTLFRVDSSGSVREELLGPALPDGFVPLAIESRIPARLESDGRLRLQVRPGSWDVTLVARAGDVLSEISLPQPSSNLPMTEIWSYRADDTLRVSVPEGLPSIDPMQSGVPPTWAELPGFRVDSGESLKIAERSRGAVGAGNQLTLDRRLWLDFNGEGFVFSDDIGGEMRRDWRLDMAEPYALLSATEDGENLLVTHGADRALTGVELRKTDVGLSAIGRTESRGALPVTGWKARFNHVETTLHLPPGAKLLAATGSDRASGSWVHRWKLLDFFLVLIVSISAARLFGIRIGLLSLLALTLSIHEVGSPKFVWLSLLVAVALTRVAPPGMLHRFSRGFHALCLLGLIGLFIPFAVGQLRIAIYPQLEPQRSSVQHSSPPGPLNRVDVSSLGYGTEDQAVQAEIDSIRKRSEVFNRYAPSAIVQVGPGRPAWNWNSYQLRWSGPVSPDQTTRIVVVPRWLTTILRFLSTGLLAALVAVFALELIGRRIPGANDPPPQAPARPAAGTVVGAILAILFASASFAPPVSAAGQVPSDSILQELQRRLVRPPECAPRCAEIVSADVEVEADSMSVRLAAHALSAVAVPLPGSLQGWRPESIQVDGAPATRIFRGSDGVLWVPMSAGIRQIRLRGPLPPVDSLEIPFPTPPRVIRVAASDWFVAGVENRRLSSGSLQLTRLQDKGKAGSAAESAARWESSRFPAFVRVERSISLNLEWRVATTIHRVAPQQGAISLQVPLLDGESVLSEGVSVTDGSVRVAMNPSEASISWESTLPRESPFVLKAAADARWKEVWRFSIGGIWHVEFSGIPESEVGAMESGFRVAQFFPRAGESLTMTVDRPEASAGDTLVFDEARLSTEIGARSRSSNLSLSYRSSRGAQHLIELPAESEVVGVEIDGKPSQLRAEGGDLRIPILPGAHRISIDWRHDRTVRLREQSPRVDLGAASGNIHTRMQLAPNRWVLATAGPRLGPAVLYWSELVVLIIVAWLLGRERWTPLRRRDWLLLGLGFSTFSWLALALVAIWLLIAGLLAQRKQKLQAGLYNGVQLLFAGLSVIALGTIVVSLPIGLLSRPDMHILGNGSRGNDLQWFADRSDSVLPGTDVLSVPMWIYKILILVWALWISFALLRWLPWVWRQFADGGLWRQAPSVTASPDVAPPGKPKA